MKKFIILIIICLLFIPCIYADDEVEAETEAVPGLVAEDEYSWDYEDDVDLGGFWIQDRGFEMSLFYFNNIYFANNLVSVDMILSEVIQIDLDNLPSIIQVQAGFDLALPYFKFDSKKGWGFGLASQLQITGFTGLNFDITKISDAKDKKSDLGFASYYNIMPSAFFHIQNFKISVMPTIFLPLAYATSKISYTLDGSDPPNADFKYNIKMYLPLDYDKFSDGGIPTITSQVGVDISAGVEYPLSKELGLENIHSIFNFDVGAAFYALPFVSGTMKNGLNINGKMEVDGSDIMKPKFDDEYDQNSFSKKKSIYRPFVMHFWSYWRPLGTELITVTNLLGFAVNTLYVEPGSIEGGITGHLNLSNLFHVKLGINYLDRMWINSLFLALNLRAIELNLGLSLRSQDFAKSWEGAGLGVTFGGKIGW